MRCQTRPPSSTIDCAGQTSGSVKVAFRSLLGGARSRALCAPLFRSSTRLNLARKRRASVIVTLIDPTWRRDRSPRAVHSIGEAARRQCAGARPCRCSNWNTLTISPRAMRVVRPSRRVLARSASLAGRKLRGISQARDRSPSFRSAWRWPDRRSGRWRASPALRTGSISRTLGTSSSFPAEAGQKNCRRVSPLARTQLRAALGAATPRLSMVCCAAPGIHPGSDLNLRFDDEAINQAAVECEGVKPNRHDHRAQRAANCNSQSKRLRLPQPWATPR